MQVRLIGSRLSIEFRCVGKVRGGPSTESMTALLGLLHCTRFPFKATLQVAVVRIHAPPTIT